MAFSLSSFGSQQTIIAPLFSVLIPIVSKLFTSLTYISKLSIKNSTRTLRPMVRLNNWFLSITSHALISCLWILYSIQLLRAYHNINHGPQRYSQPTTPSRSNSHNLMSVTQSHRVVKLKQYMKIQKSSITFS